VETTPQSLGFMPGVYASERVCSGGKVSRRDIVVVLTLFVAIVGAFGLRTSGLGRGGGIDREARSGGGIEREHERAVVAAGHIAKSCGWAYDSLDPVVAFSRCRVDNLERVAHGQWIVRFEQIRGGKACVTIDLHKFHVIEVGGRLLADDSGGPEPPELGDGRQRALCPTHFS
jgi:hypothetical protein